MVILSSRVNQKYLWKCSKTLTEALADVRVGGEERFTGVVLKLPIMQRLLVVNPRVQRRPANHNKHGEERGT